MNKNCNREKAPIHLYVSGETLPEETVQWLEAVQREGIDALWIEMTDGGETEDSLDSVSNGSQDAIICELPIVYCPVSGSAVRKALHSNAAGVAVDPRWVDHVIEHTVRGKKQHLPLYLSSPLQSPDTLKGELEIVALAVEKLRTEGFHNLFCHMPTAHSTTLYNAYGFLKRELNVQTVVSAAPGETGGDSLFEIALQIGSLFYEGFADLILLNPNKLLPPERDEITSLLNMVKRTLGTIGRYPVGYSIISCPMCGRCEIDIQGMTEQVERILQSIGSDYRKRGMPLEEMGGITVAVMGCNVNGPGEAKGADIGIAGGRGKTGTIFMKGSPIETLPEEDLLDEFEKLVSNLVNEKMSSG